MGMLDRGMREVRAKVVPNVRRETLQNEVLREVKYGSPVYTDQHPSYNSLHYRFVHDVVNHLETYVNGQVHTNGIENFWSLLKRTLKGTYVAVEPFHLQRYVDEQVFRFNNRGGRKKGERISDADRFRQGSRSGSRQAPDLCRVDRQGGRNAVLNLGAGNVAQRRSRIALRPILFVVFTCSSTADFGTLTIFRNSSVNLANVSVT